MQQQKVSMGRKQFRIGDLAKELRVKKCVIRFWEREFKLKSDRSQGGQRFYTNNDLEVFGTIKNLLYDQGFTIAGAKKHLSAVLAGEQNPVTVADGNYLSHQALQHVDEGSSTENQAAEECDDEKDDQEIALATTTSEESDVEKTLQGSLEGSLNTISPATVTEEHSVVEAEQIGKTSEALVQAASLSHHDIILEPTSKAEQDFILKLQPLKAQLIKLKALLD